MVEIDMNTTGVSIDSVRADFPFFAHQSGSKVVFLDSAASAQKPQVVLDVMGDFTRYSYANVHRGLYELSQKATEGYEHGREKVRDFLNSGHIDEIVFTGNATIALNLLAFSWGSVNLGRGDAMIISQMEHHANMVPWFMLRERTGFELRICRILDDGSLDMDHFHDLLTDNVKLVSITGMSNVMGTYMPLEHIIDKSHAVGARVSIDACQLVAHCPIDVQKLDADFIVFSAHKLYGPTGIGVLYGKGHLLQEMSPMFGGGDMIKSVSFDGFVPADPPARFEAGTPPIVQAVGLGAAIDYIKSIGWDFIQKHEAEVSSYLFKRLKTIDGISILANQDSHKAGIFSFSIDGINHDDIAILLDKIGVCIRTGHHCAEPLMSRLGVTGLARASIGFYTTKEDVDALIDGLNKIKMMFS